MLYVVNQFSSEIGNLSKATQQYFLVNTALLNIPNINGHPMTI